MTKHFTKTKIRKAIADAMIRDAFLYHKECQETLEREGYREITFPDGYQSFYAHYHRVEQMVSFLFGRKVTRKFTQLKEDRLLPKDEAVKWDRYTKCHGRVFRHDSGRTCNNRLCGLCYSKALYRMYGDLKPFLAKGRQLTMIIFEEPVLQHRHALSAGVLFSEKLINPLITKTRGFRHQYVRLPFWRYDPETGIPSLCMAFIIVHDNDPRNLLKIEQSVLELKVPYNAPFMITDNATVDTLAEWIPQYLKYPLSMMFKYQGAGLEEFLRSNNWYRYKSEYPNKERRGNGLIRRDASDHSGEDGEETEETNDDS